MASIAISINPAPHIPTQRAAHRGPFERLLSAIQLPSSPSMIELEDVLREHHETIEEMGDQQQMKLRRWLFSQSPIGACVEAICEQNRSARQTFMGMLDQSRPETWSQIPRLLGNHLALAIWWEARKEYRKAATLLGLLLRMGMAAGQQGIINRCAARLDTILQLQPQLGTLSVNAVTLRQARQAWRCWGASANTCDPETLFRLARLLKGRADATAADADAGLEEIAVLERLLEVSNPKNDAPLRGRAILRLMELYQDIGPQWPSACRRGLDLLPQWATAATLRNKPLRDIDAVLNMATGFEQLLDSAGCANSDHVLVERLQEALYILEKERSGSPHLVALNVGLANARLNKLGTNSDSTELERIWRLYAQGHRLARGNRPLRNQIRAAATAVMGRWLETGDPGAQYAANKWLGEGCPRDANANELVNWCTLHLSLPQPQRQQFPWEEASRLAQRILQHPEASAKPYNVALALVIRSLACINASQSGSGRHLHNAVGWLRRAIALLGRQLKRNRAPQSQQLQGRALLALGHVQLALIKHCDDEAETLRLQRQALRDVTNAQRIFSTQGLGVQAAEALWIQSRLQTAAIARSTTEQRQRLDDARRTTLAGLALLGGTYESRLCVGQHTEGKSLRELLIHRRLEVESMDQGGFEGKTLRLPSAVGACSMRHAAPDRLTKEAQKAAKGRTLSRSTSVKSASDVQVHNLPSPSAHHYTYPSNLESHHSGS